MIPQSFIEEVRARTDIVELISSYIPLKRAGRNFKALCPFHSEKTSSFVVSPQKQIFHCFGCSQGGGVTQFLMLYERVSFVEALEMLANRLGLEVPYQKAEKNKIKTILYDAVYEASLFFHKNLMQNPAQNPFDYLDKRGINQEAIIQFRLGFAFGKNTLLDFLRKKGFALETLEKASLITSQRSAPHDLFQQRIIFPIFDVRSRVVGFGARTCRPACPVGRQDKNIPKYINSPENSLYSKREHLFGLNFSKEDILKKDCVIVVEGYLDMIIPFMHGIKNIVASLGTALTLEQIYLIKRYTSNIILVFDSDKAGEMATLRTLDLLLENDLKVWIVKLPSGYDPDSLVRDKGKDYFLQFLGKKQDFFDYKIGILKNIHDRESIEGKTKIVQEMLAAIDKLNSEVQRYEYIKKLSEVVKVKEEILLLEFRKISSSLGKNKDNRTVKKSALGGGVISITEKLLLRFMFTKKGAFSLVRKNLTEEDFTSSLARKTVSYFFKNYPQGESAFLKSLAVIEDKEISGFVSAILMDEDIPIDKESFKSSLIKLHKNRTNRLKDKLKEEIKEAEAGDDRQRLKALVSRYNKMIIAAKNG